MQGEDKKTAPWGAVLVVFFETPPPQGHLAAMRVGSRAGSEGA